MNDPLKKFIDRHSSELDDLEPSPLVLSRIKKEMQGSMPQARRKTAKLGFPEKWLAAAAVMAMLFTGYLVFSSRQGKQLMDKDPLAGESKVAKKPKEEIAIEPVSTDAVLSVAKTNHSRKKTRSAQKFESIPFEKLYRELQDSSSSSTRLAAILRIGHSGMVSYDTVDRLARTLDEDGSTNVRLAALELLGRYSEDNYVGSLLIKSLRTQRDPIAQLGLIDLLDKTGHSQLAERLYALADDPGTPAAVKDQAYVILLHQKLL